MTPKLELRLALTANGVFSLGCALPMMLAENSLSTYLGMSASLIFIVGLVVGLNGLCLLTYGAARSVPKALLTSAVWGDIAWVVASGVFLLLAPDLTSKGVLAVVLVATVVGVFAVLQKRGLQPA